MISFSSQSISFASLALAILQRNLLLAQAPDSDLKCHAIPSNAKSYTVPDIGAGQGVALINNKLYFYKYGATPRVEVIKENKLKMTPTGRALLLNQNGKQKSTHPIGIKHIDKNNVFSGDNVSQKAKIYLLDWE